MKSTKSAIRYAKALLELSVEQNNFDKVALNMQEIANATSNRDFLLLINSPIVNVDKKIAIFDTVFTNFEELSKKFIHLITKNRREYLLAAIAESYLKILKEQKGITEVTLSSAATLDEATKALILSKIKSLTSDKVEVVEKVDESLIGGFTIQIEDQKVDASVANQLRTIKQRLTK